MRPIGVFDSGVGGLGIFKAVTEKLPYHDFVYIADNANLPFGEKSIEQLHEISEKIVRFLIETHNVQMVIIACNTATVTCINYLRARFTIPIVGAVPVVKPSCEQSKTKRIAIMATPATIQSNYLKKLIRENAHDKTSGEKLVDVLPIACPGLASMVDTGNLDSPELIQALKNFLAPALAHNIDVIGLGCTQYPFVRKQIEKLIPSHILILDSTDPVAKQAERVITAQDNYTVNQEHSPVYTFYATKDAPTFCTVAQKLIGPIVKTCHEVSMDSIHFLQSKKDSPKTE